MRPEACWKRDGRDLAAEEGGPLRSLAAPDSCDYKGVKWAARIHLRRRHRDYRRRAHFEPAKDGLAYRWCAVHDQLVKMYHPGRRVLVPVPAQVPRPGTRRPGRAA